MSTTIEHVVCPTCGCLCDDLVVEVEAGRIVRTRRACPNGQSRFSGYDAAPHLPSVDGHETDWDSAIEAAGQILVQARSPLIYGLSSTATEAQRCAVELADRLGAILDTTSSVCHGPAVLAMQSVGLPGCTLGEVRDRADLVIFWGCNPAVSHPRHFSRYSLPLQASVSSRHPGSRTPGTPSCSSGARFAVAVDVRPTATSERADLFLQIEPGRDFEILTTLRALVQGKQISLVRRPAPAGAEAIGGLALNQWRDLAERMKACRFGVVFAGVGLTMSQGRDLNLSELFRLVAELNDYTRFAAIPMRGHGNVSGADQVLTWQSGYPFAVSYSRGYPRYGPGEFSAVDVLARGEADAALILASDPLAHLPVAAASRLRDIPMVVLDPRPSFTTQAARVVLPTASYGVDAAGTFYRMDGVPIRLRAVLPTVQPTDEQLLRRLIRRLPGCASVGQG